MKKRRRLSTLSRNFNYRSEINLLCLLCSPPKEVTMQKEYINILSWRDWSSPKWRRHRPRSRIRSLNASHTTNKASRCRESGEFRTAETTNIMADRWEAAEGCGAKLRGIFLWIDWFVWEPSLQTHINQASQLVLLARWSFREEEVQHLLRVIIVLNFHIAFDGGSNAVDSVLCEERQRTKMTRQPRHLLLCTDHARAMDLLEPRNFLKRIKRVGPVNSV